MRPLTIEAAEKQFAHSLDNALVAAGENGVSLQRQQEELEKHLQGLRAMIAEQEQEPA